MRRFGDAEAFLDLVQRVRALAPEAGIRSNVIVGFPGETDADLDVLCDFLVAARLDVTGVFGYSDEDGTEAATYADKLDDPEVAPRASTGSPPSSRSSPRSARPTGSESASRCSSSRSRTAIAEGRAAHQGPEVDGTSTLPAEGLEVGDLVPAVVTDSLGVDLVAERAGEPR